MKAKNLSAVWDSPDNSRLMKRQTSVRLATHIEARIAALCEMYPARTKSQFINDLLAAALDQIGESFEFVPAKDVFEEYTDQGPCLFESDVGKRTKFLKLANNFLVQYELEIGNEEPTLFEETRVREVGAE